MILKWMFWQLWSWGLDCWGCRGPNGTFDTHIDICFLFFICHLSYVINDELSNMSYTDLQKLRAHGHIAQAQIKMAGAFGQFLTNLLPYIEFDSNTDQCQSNLCWKHFKRLYKHQCSLLCSLWPQKSAGTFLQNTICPGTN